MAHALRYYKNIVREDGKRIRIEFHEKDGTAAAMELGDVIQSLSLDIQGGGDIDEPIVKTMLNFTLVDAPDHPDHKTKKCGSWEEFYSPDATRWKVLLLSKDSVDAQYTQFWGGYITPDSFRESLTYRGSVSFIARDNIGHLQDFPFDAEGNADGMISLYDLLTEAWAKIESPMELVTKTDGDAKWLKCEGSNALYTYMNVSVFEGKNWLEAVTDALYGYGLVMRYVGENKVYVYPLRNLAVFPYGGSGVDVIFERGAERELSPAVKRIEESVGYDLEESLPQPLVKNKKDFTGSVEKLDFTKENQPYTIEYWKLNRTKAGDGWINGASLPRYFNPLGYAVADNVDDKDLSYMWIACAYYTDVAADGRAIEYSRYIQAASLAIDVKLGHTHAISNNKLTRTQYNELLIGCTAYCVVTVTQNGITKYLDSNGKWSAEKKMLSLEIEDSFSINVPQGDFTGEVLLSFKIADIKGDWGAAYIPIYSVTYTTINNPLLTANRVNTNYNEQNNVILSRSPKIAPAMDKTFMQGVIKNGIFTKQGSRYYPAKLWSWNANGTGAQQMAVYNHLQLLCYYAKPNNILSGTILNADVTNIGKVYRWEGTEHLLVSGTLNLINGFIEGATLREFARYEDMWGEITDTADLPEVEEGGTNNVDGGARSGGNAATYSSTYEINIGGGGGTMVLDTYMSDSSTNGVQNKVIKSYVDSAVDTLETSIGTKAKQSDLTALQTKVSANETAIADRYTKAQVDAKVKTLTDADTALGNRITPLETWKSLKESVLAKFTLDANGNVYLDGNLVVKGDTASGGSGDPSTNQGIDIEELKKYLDDNKYIDEYELSAYDYANKTYVDNKANTISTALNNAISSKADRSSLASVATSGKYSDLSGLPTKLSQFTDDVVSGNYLPLDGGTMNANSTIKWTHSNDENWNTAVKGLKILRYASTSNASSNGSFANYATALHIANSATYGFQIGYNAGHTDNNYISSLKYRGYSPNSSAWSDWKTIAFTDSDITGNAATATKLATARTIWGQSFDGSANVTGNLNLGTSKLHWHNDATNYAIYTNYTLNSGSPNLNYKAYSGHIFLTGTTTAMVINPSGNVGIGTTRPSHKLDVYGRIRAYRDSATESQIDAENTVNRLSLGVNAAGVSYLYSPNAYDMAFSTNATRRMTITSGGNVGIGTASPEQKLDVSGNIRAFKTDASVSQIYSTNSAGSVSLYVAASGNRGILDATNSAWVLYTDGTKTTIDTYPLKITKAVTMSSNLSVSGNVGIGNDNPAYALDIAAGGGMQLKHTTNPLFKLTSDSYYAYVQLLSSGDLAIGKSSALGLHIAQSGAVSTGYGITAKTLTISSTATEAHIAFSRTSANYLSAPEGGTIRFVTNGKALTIANSDFTISDKKIQVNGDAVISGDTSSGSDIRFKDVIEHKTLSLDTMANAPLFSFRWNDREDKTLHLGTSAQYWEEAIPELVSGSDFKTLNYASLGVAMGISLAKKAQNHEDRIKQLEKENKELKEKLYGQVC